MEVPMHMWEEIYEGNQVFVVSGLAFLYHGFRVFWQREWGQPENTELDKREEWGWYEKNIKPLSLSAEALIKANEYFSMTGKVWKKDFKVKR